MVLNEYHFESVWSLSTTTSAAFEVLQDLPGYVMWWPEIRSVEVIDDQTARVRIRAFLPYSLTIKMQQSIVDPVAGILRAKMSGDLEGWSQWQLTSQGNGVCTLIFQEEVVVRKPLLRVLAPIARPLFRANHAVMMTRGERGLNRLLANRLVVQNEGERERGST